VSFIALRLSYCLIDGTCTGFVYKGVDNGIDQSAALRGACGSNSVWSSNVSMDHDLPLKSGKPFEPFAELARKLFAVSK
jgi:hypothetical protein